MTKVELQKKYDTAFYEYIKTGHTIDNLDEMMCGIFSLMWEKAPHKIHMYNLKSYMKKHLETISKMMKCVDGEEKEDEEYDTLIVENSFINMYDALDKKKIRYITIRYGYYPIIITEKMEIIIYDMTFNYISCNNDTPDWFNDSLVKPVDDSTTYDYLIFDKDGFTTMPLEIKKNDVDIKLNYNDDIPYEDLIDFLNSDESGLVILNGEPGTGKSNFIRHLINTVDRDFLYLDQTSFENVTDASFMRTLSSYENACIIFEDCESILKGREEGNTIMTTLLNLTDGLIGDSFKFKIICTFNTKLSNIDKALLRKGRLKIKYEFKKLKSKKADKLLKKLGKKPKKLDMFLTDIYNDENSTNVINESEKNIGFLSR